jgi:hypothetical protein
LAPSCAGRATNACAPAAFGSAKVNDVLWHIAVNRLVDVNEQLIRGGEDIYFGFEFATRPAKKLRDYAVR